MSEVPSHLKRFAGEVVDQTRSVLRAERGGMPMDRAVRVMRVLDTWEPGCSAKDMRHVIRRLRAALDELEATLVDPDS